MERHRVTVCHNATIHTFMTTKERQNVRAALLAADFRRETRGEEPNHYDIALTGVYTEVWRSHKDRTRITLEWDRKTP